MRLTLALLLAVLVVSLRPAAARPAALPDIPACGTSREPVAYLICAVNTLHAENQALQARLADVEQLRGVYRERLWAFAGDRGEFDERRRLTFQDNRRQLQTRDQIYRALCRERLIKGPCS